jgi:hypothetical protein
MAGLLAEPPDALAPTGAPPAESGSLPDGHASDGIDLLTQIETRINDTVPPKLKQSYLAIVVAGRQMMFSEKTHSIMEAYMREITSAEDVPKIVAHGIIKMIAELHKQSQGKMSVDASAPAAITLMTYALKYVDGQLGIPVTKAMIDETTTATTTGLFAFWGVSQAQIQDAIQGKAGGSTPPQDPPAQAPSGTERTV